MTGQEAGKLLKIPDKMTLIGEAALKSDGN